MRRVVGVAFLLLEHHVAPIDDGPRLLYCIFPRPSLVKQRSAREAPVVREHVFVPNVLVACRTPHLAVGAGGACGLAPESGTDSGTLGSTTSVSGSCTADHSQLPIFRHRLMPAATHVDSERIYRHVPAPGMPAEAELSDAPELERRDW